MHPRDRRYTSAHEWVLPVGPSTVRFGITEFAAESLGDVVFVSLPEVGDQVSAGSPCGEVESTKSVADVFAPVSGTVSAVNDVLVDAPETVNTEPHEGGWMAEVELEPGTDPETAIASLLTAEVYEELISSHSQG